MVRPYALSLIEQLNNTKLNKELVKFRLNKCEIFCVNKLNVFEPTGNYTLTTETLEQVNADNRNTRTSCELCSKITIKTPCHGWETTWIYG